MYARLTDGKNIGTTVKKKITNIDKEVPIITSLTLNITEFTTEKINLTAKAKDTLSGISHYQWTTSSSLNSSSDGWVSITNTNEEITQNYEVAENGTYYFYAKDQVGNIAKKSIKIDKIDTTKPSITNAEIKNITPTGYDVYVYGVTDENSGVNRVQFPTWTDANDQDDLKSDWETNSAYSGTKQSDGTTWVYHVNIEDHNNEAGLYNTHIYIYDNVGNGGNVKSLTATVPELTLTINPNGGTYNNTTNETTVTQKYKSIYGLSAPTLTGNSISKWDLSGGGTLTRGNASGINTLGSCFTSTVKTDTDGSSYTNYTMNYTNSTSNTIWPYLDFANYTYTSGHTYKVSAMIRTKKMSGLQYLILRHSAKYNDWGTPGYVKKDIEVNSDWAEYTLERTFTGTTTTLSGNTYEMNPVVEIYGAISAGETGILDMDVKNLRVYDETDGTYISTDTYSGYIYEYGSESGTVTANYTANTYTINFNANGGSVSPTSITKKYGETLGTLPTPTRSGYTFWGWYTSASGGTKVDSTTKVPAGDVTYYAQWKYLENGKWYFVGSNKNTNYRLNVSGFSSSNSTNVQIYSDKTGASMWKVVINSDGTYSFMNLQGRYLDIAGGKIATGTNIQSWSSSQGGSPISCEKFDLRVYDEKNAIFYIISHDNNNLVVDVCDGTMANSTNVQLCTSNNTNAQQWKFDYINDYSDWNDIDAGQQYVWRATAAFGGTFGYRVNPNIQKVKLRITTGWFFINHPTYFKNAVRIDYAAENHDSLIICQNPDHTTGSCGLLRDLWWNGKNLDAGVHVDVDTSGCPTAGISITSGNDFSLNYRIEADWFTTSVGRFIAETAFTSYNFGHLYL